MVSSTSAVLAWEAVPDVGFAYDYVVSDRYIAPKEVVEGNVNADTEGVIHFGTAVELPDNTLAIDQLQPGTDYYVLLRRNCNKEFAGQSDLATFQFVTQCLPLVLDKLPVEATFDEALSIPNCWTLDGENLPVIQSDYKYGESGNAVRLESSAIAASRLYTPFIKGSSALTTVRCRIYTNATTPQKYSVGIANQAADGSISIVPLRDETIVPGNWQNIYIADNGTFSDNYAWVISTEAGEASIVYVDEVMVSMNTCIPPAELSISDVTENTATIGWVEQSTSRSWTVELTPQGGDPIFLPVSQTSLVYDQLTEQTVYTVRVKSHCQDGDSDWTNVATFKTKCSPQTLPLFESFENGISDCWTNFHTEGLDNRKWTTDVAPSNISQYVHTGIQSAYMSPQPAGNKVILATPLFHVEAGKEYSVNFWVTRRNWNETDEILNVYTNTATIVDKNAVLLGGLPSHYASSPQEPQPGMYNYEYTWIAESDEPVCVIFEQVCDNAMSIGLDDIRIGEVVCKMPGDLRIVGITGESITVAWSPRGNDTEWIVNVHDKAHGLEQTIPISGEPRCTINLFEEQTYYEDVTIEVQAVCSAQAKSEALSRAFTFTTSCLPKALPYFSDFETEGTGSYPSCWLVAYTNQNGYPKVLRNGLGESYEGVQYVYSPSVWGTSEPFESMCALPLVAGTEVKELTLRFFMMGKDANLVVGVLIDPMDVTTFVPIQTIVGTAQYKEYEVSFTDYTGNGQYIALKYDKCTMEVCLDNLTILKTPECGRIASFTIDDIGVDAAIVNIEDIGKPEWMFEVKYGSVDFDPDTDGILVTSEIGRTSVRLTDIPQGWYDVYVRSNCGGNAVGEWNGPRKMKMRQPPVELPFRCDFETPHDWYLENGTAVNCWVIGTNSNLTGSATKALYVRNRLVEDKWNYNKNQPSNTWALKAFRVEKRTSYLFEFDWLGVGESRYDYALAFIIPAGTAIEADSNHGISIENNQISHPDDWLLIGGKLNEQTTLQHVSEEIELEAGDYQLAFYWRNDNSSGEDPPVAIDNIVIDKVNCPRPSIPVVESITDNTAVLSWGLSESAQSYVLKVFTERPADIETATPVYTENDITGNRCTIPDLEAHHTYYAYLRSICDLGVSVWSSAKEFKTECVPVQLPYDENFEQDETYVDCWTTIGDEGSWTMSSSGYTGNNSMSGYNITVISPRLDLDGGSLADWELSGFVWYMASQNETLGIGIAKSSTDLNSYQQVKTISIPDDYVWQEFTIDFTALSALPDADQYHYIVFTFPNTTTLSIDDLSLHRLPSCPKPTDIQLIDVDDKAVTVDWNVRGSELNWHLVVKRTDGTECYNQIVDKHPIEITGLKPASDYVISVAAFCEVGDTSVAITANFKTECGVEPLPFVQDFDELTMGVPECWNHDEGTSSLGNKWQWSPQGYQGTNGVSFNSQRNPEGMTSYLKTPPIALNKPARCSFVYKNPRVGEYGGVFSIYISTDAGMTYLDKPLRKNLQVDDWQNITIDLSEYTGQNVTLVFEGIAHSENNRGESIYLDNLMVEEIPTCERPGSMEIGLITHNSVELLFADELHSAWECIVGHPGFKPSEQGDVRPVTGSGQIIEGLLSDTEYDIYLRAVCDVTDKSQWVGPAGFITACDVVTNMPFVEDFEDGINRCWTNEVTAGEAEQLWKISSDPQYVHSGKQAAILYVQDNMVAVALETPLLQMQAGKDYRLEFYMYRHDYPAPREHMKVYRKSQTGVAISIDSISNYFACEPVVEEEGLFLFAYEWTAESTEPMSVVFEQVSAFGSNVSLDDIRIEEIQTCDRPTKVTVKSVNADAIMLDIVDPRVESWQIAVGRQGFDPDAVDINYLRVDDRCSLVETPVIPNQPSELYVRSICNVELEEYGAWYGPVEFTYVNWNLLVGGNGCELQGTGGFPWEIVYQDGMPKLQSTNVGQHSSNSQMQAKVKVAEGEKAVLTFDYYVSSESSDYLYLVVDDTPDESYSVEKYDTEFGKVTGETVTGSYSIEWKTPGEHVVYWVYWKDYFSSAGEDKALVWNINLTKSRFYAPDDLQLLSVTDAIARWSWNASVEAVSHEVKITDGTNERVIRVEGVSELEIDGLSPFTIYSINVRSVNAQGEFTAWSEPSTFTTTPIAAIVPFSEDFEGEDVNNSWILANDIYPNKWMIGAGVNQDVGQALYVSDNGQDNIYDVTALSTVYAYQALYLEQGVYTLTYDWRANGEAINDYLRVFLIPAILTPPNGVYAGSCATAPDEWIPLDNNYGLFGVTEWQQIEQRIYIDKADNYYLAFMWINNGSNGSQSPAAVDNITITQMECAPVSDLRVVDIQDVTATIVWESYGAENFQVACAPAGTGIASLDEDDFKLALGNLLTLDNLNPITEYDIYVRSVCDDDTSVWEGPLTIKTMYSVATLPYATDFSDASKNEAWYLINGTQPNAWVIGTSASQKSHGDHALYISDNNGESHAYSIGRQSTVYASLSFKVAKAGRHVLSFDWINVGENKYDVLDVFILPASFELTEGNKFSESSLPDGAVHKMEKLAVNSSWRNEIIEDLDLEVGMYQLVFMWSNDFSGGAAPPAGIDNVTLKALSCLLPSDVKIEHLKTTGAYVAWKGEADKYEIKVADHYGVIQENMPVIDTITSQLSVQLDGLPMGTELYLVMRSICGLDTSEWTIPQSFKTLCGEYTLPYRETFQENPLGGCWEMYTGPFESTTSIYSLSKSINSWEHVSTNVWSYMSTEFFMQASNWLISPAITITEQALLRFDLALWNYFTLEQVKQGQQDDDRFIFAISEDDGLTWTFDKAVIWDNVRSERVLERITPEQETVSISLEQYVGKTIRVAFYSESTDPNNNVVNVISVSNVDIIPALTVVLEDSICAGIDYENEHFKIKASELTPGKMHTFNEVKEPTSQGGLQQLFTLRLYVYSEAKLTVYDTICASMPYTEYGFDIPKPETRVYISRPGQVQDTDYGCDSTIMLHLFVPQTEFTEWKTVCEEELPYDFGGQLLTETGTYTKTFSGLYCDSVVTLHFTVLPSESSFPEEICSGDSVFFGGIWYRETGNYTYTCQNILGCDSVVTMQLSVVPAITYSYGDHFCEGYTYESDNFRFNGLSAPGTYRDTVESLVTGCDSIIILTLTQLTPDMVYLPVEICEGESYLFDKTSYTQSTQQTGRFKNQNGCDSIVHLMLTVLPVQEKELELELTLDQLPYKLLETTDSIYYLNADKPGITWPDVQVKGGASNGCDSIIHVTLTVTVAGGLQHNEMGKLLLRPNPIEREGIAVIDYDFSLAERNGMVVSVYNAIGRCISVVRPIETGPIYLKDFDVSGLYMVKVVCGNGNEYVGRLIVK